MVLTNYSFTVFLLVKLLLLCSLLLSLISLSLSITLPTIAIAIVLAFSLLKATAISFPLIIAKIKSDKIQNEAKRLDFYI